MAMLPPACIATHLFPPPSQARTPVPARIRKPLKKASSCATEAPTTMEKSLCHRPSSLQLMRTEASILRMWSATKDAYDEHFFTGPLNYNLSVYAGWQEVLLPLDDFISAPDQPKLSCCGLSCQGKLRCRKTMEDRCFRYILQNENVLAGVFDGHGGAGVSDYCKEKFTEKFSKYLLEQHESVYNSFRQVFYEIQNDVSQNESLTTAGCTAVVSYLDLSKRFIYTATVGDSEATIYRRSSQAIKAIPLSCVCNWSRKEEEERAYSLFPLLKEQWEKTVCPKKRMCPPLRGLNVSRVIGDTLYEMGFKSPFSHEPIVTIQKLFENDLLILASNGLKDFVTEREIIDKINIEDSEPSISEKLVCYAIEKKKSLDDVTIVSLKILGT